MDGEIALAFGWKKSDYGDFWWIDGTCRWGLPAFTASIDAALSLVPDDTFVFWAEWDDEPVSHPLNVSFIAPGREVEASAKRPLDPKSGSWKAALARVICAAALRARAEIANG